MTQIAFFLSTSQIGQGSLDILKFIISIIKKRFNKPKTENTSNLLNSLNLLNVLNLTNLSNLPNLTNPKTSSYFNFSSIYFSISSPFAFEILPNALEILGSIKLKYCEGILFLNAKILSIPALTFEMSFNLDK